MENLLIKYPDTNNVELFIDQMNIDLFKYIPEFTIDTDNLSIISKIYYNGCYNDELEATIKSFLENLTKEDISQLSKEEILSLIDLYYFDLKSLPCVLSVLDMDFVSGEYGRNKGINFRLSDPAYLFPELNFTRHLETITNITANEVLNVFEARFYDYATYSIGDSNSDLRDETMEYFSDFLKPAILNSDKAIQIQEKIVKLESLFHNLSLIKLDLEILNNVKKENLCHAAKVRLQSVKSAKRVKFNDLPSSFSCLNDIQLKITELREGL